MKWRIASKSRNTGNRRAGDWSDESMFDYLHDIARRNNTFAGQLPRNEVGIPLQVIYVVESDDPATMYPPNRPSLQTAANQEGAHQDAA